MTGTLITVMYFIAVFLVLLLFIYLRYGILWSVFQSLKSNIFEKAKIFLRFTPYTPLLCKTSKGYYNWGLAIINLKEKNVDLAESFLLKAIEYSLRTKNDLAIVYIALSEIYLSKNEYDKFNLYIDKATSTPHKHLLNEGIDRLKSSYNKKISNEVHNE